MFKKLHMVGNAHIDPTWLWRWTDGYETVRSTFRSALDRMNEYPEFTFTSACAVYYEWMQKCEPEMFEEIKQRVKEGRWHVVGGWYLQPDCNIPSGESFARHALISQNWLMDNLGVQARTGYNVDSFGHTGTLPKILEQSGLKRYVYMRPGDHERAYDSPCAFKWQTQTGESVTAFRIPGGYNSGYDELKRDMDACLALDEKNEAMMCFYGVGNHGGGPTKANIEYILEARSSSEKELAFSDPDTFFDELDTSNLKTETGDLFHHASGCYAAHSGVKMLNRKSENALLTAEKWAAVAGMYTGAPDKGAELTRAWKKVLYNQFHDVMAGTSIKSAYEDTTEDFGYALSVAKDISNEAMQRVVSHIEVPFIEGAQPYIVFNPHSFEVTAPVIIDIGVMADDMTLLDDNNDAVPMQMLTPSGAVYGRSRVCFVATVPPLGYRRYIAVPKKQPEYERKGGLILENGLVKVVFDETVGEIISFFDKTNGCELLSAPTDTLIFPDDSDTWSHDKFVFDGEKQSCDETEIKLLDEGSLRKTISVRKRYGTSLIRRDYTLYEGLKELRIACAVDWHETQKCLKFAYPVNVSKASVLAQEAFGYADRNGIKEGQECPMQMWLDVGDGEKGLVIYNDGKYSCDVHANTAFITVLRSPYYANHTPFVVKPGMDFPVMDQGLQEFNLVIGGRKEPDPAENERQALSLNAPLTILPEYAHKGDLPAAHSFAALNCDHAVIDAVKTALDGSGDIIVHLHETARRAGDAVLTLFGSKLNLSLKPGELCVWRMNPACGTFTKVDLLEKQ